MIRFIRIVIRTKGLNHAIRLIGQIDVNVHPTGLRNRIVGRVLHLHSLTLDV